MSASRHPTAYSDNRSGAGKRRSRTSRQIVVDDRPTRSQTSGFLRILVGAGAIGGIPEPYEKCEWEREYFKKYGGYVLA
jgi:hypothetical protein